MTITLELPPETEARLLARAKEKGLTLDAFVDLLAMNSNGLGRVNADANLVSL